jgi:nucleotide-binding universal stress UspA family protein
MQVAIVPVAPAVRLDRILFATDFSQASLAALPIASLLAHRYGSELTLAHIWSQAPTAAPVAEAGLGMSVVIEETSRAQLEELLRSQWLKGIEVKSVLRYGDSVGEIKDLVHSRRMDLLVVGTHGVTGLSRILLGSVAEALIREVPCPVLTVGPNLEPRFKNINRLAQVLLPTDLSAHARDVVPYLVPIAAEFHSSVQVLHVLPKGAKDDLRAIAAAQDKMNCEYVQQFSPRTQVASEVEFGGAWDVTDAVLETAQSQRVDLIAMAVRPAGLMGTHFRSTVSYNIIANAPCPVLTIKSRKD